MASLLLRRSAACCLRGGSASKCGAWTRCGALPGNSGGVVWQRGGPPLLRSIAGEGRSATEVCCTPFSAVERCASPAEAPAQVAAGPDRRVGGQRAPPALAAALAAVVPTHYGETTWWLFESCIGIGSIKMGIGGLAAQVFFVAPMDVMRRIVTEKSVGGLPLLPYSAMFANGTIWVTYGYLLGNAAIWVPNVPAVAMGAVYSAIFLRYCPEDANWLPSTRNTHIFGVLGLGAVVLGASLGLETSAAAQVVGIIGNGVCIAMFGGPLAAIKTVLTDKNTKSLPFSMCIATVVNCSLWTFYGAAMLHDPLIWFPNGIGLLSGLVQLGLFMRFGIAR